MSVYFGFKPDTPKFLTYVKGEVPKDNIMKLERIYVKDIYHNQMPNIVITTIIFLINDIKLKKY